ncbi:hypothetical protein [Moorena sp. SIO3I6]|uniref:hypothetical protein n=1 Tax=Moorena sp. SIO3I6 TaxID=2607831 RepID=UPI0013F7A483|nr:hypothetical protein [Moorena sp. SIO3I6]NEP26935.1 hypothetical protein [Moorena sp. SIO3I6]
MTRWVERASGMEQASRVKWASCPCHFRMDCPNTGYRKNEGEPVRKAAYAKFTKLRCTLATDLPLQVKSRVLGVKSVNQSKTITQELRKGHLSIFALLLLNYFSAQLALGARRS